MARHEAAIEPYTVQVLAAARERRALDRRTVRQVRRGLRAGGLGRFAAWRATRRLQRELRDPRSKLGEAPSYDILVAVLDVIWAGF